MRLYILLGALALLLGALALWQFDRANGLSADLSARTQELTDAQAKTRRIQSQVLTANANAAQARQSLKEVLDASPEVRDAATPEPVRDSLCSTLRCK